MSNTTNFKINLRTKIKKSIFANIYAFITYALFLTYIPIVIVAFILAFLLNIHNFQDLPTIICFTPFFTPFSYSLAILQLFLALIIGAIVEISQAKKYNYIIDIPDKILKSKLYSFFFWIGIIITSIYTFCGYMFSLFLLIQHQIESTVH